MKTLRLQPSLKVRELKNLIEKKHNYKATMSKCFRVRAKALALIVGDYKGQFGMIRACLLYTSPSPRDGLLSRMPSSA